MLEVGFHLHGMLMCSECTHDVLKRTPNAQIYRYDSYPEGREAKCEWCRRDINLRRVRYEDWKG